ncbi:methylesterase 17-like isoform X1 [Magnolia sinica]|uniref:methylesterase 17-like isoform X1 n=1 Tax=Magnolia sinica TaxID=86752 RepID=UPI00265955DA|nr:methylesterase 17-like isoform X1 [Magnolia sinica]
MFLLLNGFGFDPFGHCSLSSNIVFSALCIAQRPSQEVEMAKIPSKSHFVFVHGASHGGWCWYKIRCLLEKAGSKVTCLDLASGGINPSDANSIFTFDEYNKPLIDFMSALPEDEKVILVGHSLGGLNVTDAMNKFVNKVHLAIYVNAQMLPQKGEDKDKSEYRHAFEIWHGLGPDKPPTGVLMRKEFHRKLMYNMSPEEDSTLAAILLRPCPVMAVANANIRVGEGVNKVTRICIRGTKDTFYKEKSFQAQIKMWPPSQILTVESDHSPFFSAPTQLFSLLVEATASISSD